MISIKEKFELQIYSLNDAPRIVEFDSDDIYINKNGCPIDNEESLGSINWDRDRILTQKLKATCDDEYEFQISRINTSYFESREKLDKMLIPEHLATDFKEYLRNIVFKQISIQKAIEQFDIQFSCNMNYYINNEKEMEKDLGGKILNFDLNDECFMKKIERELFYKQMSQLFGEIDACDKKTENDDSIYEKDFILEDFHILYCSGNKIATAKRGNYYLLFHFAS